MNKIMHIASREFTTTIATRGFILGALMLPLLLTIMATVVPRLMNQKQPQVRGTIVLIDPTGSVTDNVMQNLDLRRLAEQQVKRVRDAAQQAADRIGLADAAPTEEAIAVYLNAVPNIEVESRASVSDLDASVEWLQGRNATASDGNGEAARLAVIAVHPNAVSSNGMGADGSTNLGSYDIYAAAKLDERTLGTIQTAMRDAVIAARLSHANIDKAQVDRLVTLDRPQPKLVSATSVGAVNPTLNRLIPFILIGFLIVGVLMGASSLLSTTVEEKFSRVLEVLLSAVSPFELMAGKILGQLAVSGIVLLVYVMLGIVALSSFAMLGLVDLQLLVYLFVFFVINYLIIGAFMGAVGAAVNDLRDAQSLLMPMNLLIMVPWLLAAPILRNPDSTLSVVLSFLPPVNCFAMLLRLSSSSPPPFWQVALSVVFSLVAVYAALWFASKIFRIALLLQGKPPNLMTLIRWAKAA